jgi:GntR family transcriptional repressor for pyruvate dehydrogenase complex
MVDGIGRLVDQFAGQYLERRASSRRNGSSPLSAALGSEFEETVIRNHADHVPSPTLEPIDRREPISNEVAQSLLAYLLSGRFRPGQRIPSERKLSSELGVGRSVVREALKSLTLLGIVTVRQGDGTYLQSRSSNLLPSVIEWGLLLGAKETRDLIEARLEIEPILARLAAERRDAEAIGDLRALLDELEAGIQDRAAFVDADVRFHLRIAEAADNRVLLEFLSSLQTLLRIWIARVLDEPEDLGPSFRSHVDLVEAIESGDGERAQAVMSSHMANASSRLEAALRRHEQVS